MNTVPSQLQVEISCHGHAVGKMRNELDVGFERPVGEHDQRYSMPTDEGKFHGGEETAPPPLAYFVAGLTGCLMTQIRAFAKRLDCPLDDLKVDATVVWDWQVAGRVYESAPHSFDIDIYFDSPAPEPQILALIDAAKKGCFVEQTLNQANTIRHRYKTAAGWVDAD